MWAAAQSSLPGDGRIRITSGVYVAAEADGLTDQLRAWVRVLPTTGAFTHLTAAELSSWWLPDTPDHPTFVAMPASEPRLRRTGLTAFRHPVPPARQTLDGLPITTPAETLLALARDLTPLDLIVIADSAVRLEHVTLDELVTITTKTPRRGAPALRALLPFVDPRSESPWESIMRLLHVAADIPVETQHEIFDSEGLFVARADLWIRGTRRIHEYDGEVHRDPKRHSDDLRRDRRIAATRWERHGFTKRHLLREGSDIIRATDELLGRAWDPDRLRAWERLLNTSTLRRPGRLRLQRRWGLI